MNNQALIKNQGKQELIDITKIRLSDFNSFELNDIDELAYSIRTYGILSPLTVSGPDDDGMYEILSGSRRFVASQRINEEDGAETISQLPCMVLEDEQDDIVKQLIIELSNLDMRNLSAGELDAHRFRVIELYRELENSGVLKRAEAAKRIEKDLSISPRYRRIYESLVDDAAPELMDSVLRGESKSEHKETHNAKETKPVRITPSDAAQLASAFDKEEQKEAVKKVNSGTSPKEILKEHREEKNKANKENNMGVNIEESTQPESLENWSDDDLMNFLEANTSKPDQNISADGEIKEIISEEEKEDTYDTEISCVEKWIKKMNKVSKMSALNDTEKKLAKDIISLAEHFKKIMDE